jgi:hypothetical protein
MIESKSHIEKLREVATTQGYTTSYQSSLNKNFILGVWTSFETSITIIADNVLSDKEKEELYGFGKEDILKILKNLELSDDTVDKISELLNFKREDTLKILKGVELKKETIDKIAKKLTVKYLSGVPMSRKIKKIYAHFNAKPVLDNIGFTDFYGKMRNTLSHSNSIFHGESFEYTFKNYKFKFENGKIFTYTVDHEMPPRLYIELATHLSSIFVNLTDLLIEIEEIKYTDTGIYWEE